MRFSARTFLSFVLFAICYLLFAISPAFAQTSYNTPNMNSDVPKNLHTYSQNVLVEVTSAVICQLAGIDVINTKQPCLGVDSQTGKIGFVKNGGGMIGVMSSMITMLYTPPAHVGDYVSYLSSNFGITKKAYAQQGGYGITGLSPIFYIWNALKNIAYLLFVLIFVVIGFAIMLRVKIDPRTVMTIENQIPKLIVGMILVTFSFAIVGLLIDLMWVVTYLCINVLASAHPTGISTTLVTQEVQTPPIGFVNQIFDKSIPIGAGQYSTGGGIVVIARDTGLSVQKLISSMFAPRDFTEMFLPFTKNNCNGFDLACWVGAIVGGTVGNIVSQVVGWLASWIIGILAILIIVVALLVSLFRLWFQLITAYIYILLGTILGPFYIIGGMIPGAPFGFGSWFRDVVSNLSAFPVAIIFLLLGRMFMDAFATTKGDIFIPPLIGNPSTTNVVGSIIGLGFILLTPQVVAMMKDLLHAPQFKYSAAIGQALGTGPGVVSGGFHAATSPYGALAAFTRLTKHRGDYGTFLGALTGTVRHNKPPDLGNDAGTTPQVGTAQGQQSPAPGHG